MTTNDFRFHLSHFNKKVILDYFIAVSFESILSSLGSLLMPPGGETLFLIVLLGIKREPVADCI